MDDPPSLPESQNPWASPARWVETETFWEKLKRFMSGGGWSRLAIERLQDGDTYVCMGIGFELEDPFEKCLLAFSPSETVTPERLDLVAEEVQLALDRFLNDYQGLGILLKGYDLKVQLVDTYESDRRVHLEKFVPSNEA